MRWAKGTVVTLTSRMLAVVNVFAVGDGLDSVEDGVVIEAAGVELEVVLLDAEGVVAETGDGGLGVEFVAENGRVNVGGGVGGRGEAAEKQLGGKDALHP